MNYEFELRELIRKVKACRSAQKTYFANQGAWNRYTLLERSRQAEKDLDNMVKYIQENLDQTKLF